MMHLVYNEERLRIAVQKKGRLHDASLTYLAKRGLTFPQNGKSLMQSSEQADVDLIYLRDDDIPEYVERSVADFGIVGENVLAEKGAGLRIAAKLDFGRCKLVIAVPKSSRIKEVQDFEGKRIATSYPKLLEDFLQKNDVSADIVPISGSAEISVELDLADAVCDITQTGATLEAHGLAPIITIFDSQAVLVESPEPSLRKREFLKMYDSDTAVEQNQKS